MPGISARRQERRSRRPRAFERWRSVSATCTKLFVSAARFPLNVSQPCWLPDSAGVAAAACRVPPTPTSVARAPTCSPIRVPAVRALRPAHPAQHLRRSDRSPAPPTQAMRMSPAWAPSAELRIDSAAVRVPRVPPPLPAHRAVPERLRPAVLRLRARHPRRVPAIPAGVVAAGVDAEDPAAMVRLSSRWY